MLEEEEWPDPFLPWGADHRASAQYVLVGAFTWGSPEVHVPLNQPTLNLWCPLLPKLGKETFLARGVPQPPGLLQGRARESRAFGEASWGAAVSSRGGSRRRSEDQQAAAAREGLAPSVAPNPLIS